MHKISTVAELKASIRELEMKTKYQEQVVKQDARSTVKSIHPLNLLRIFIKRAANTPDIRSSAINTFVGLLAGSISRKIVIGKSRNIFKRTLGSAIRAFVTRWIFKKLPVVTETATRLVAKYKQKQLQAPDTAVVVHSELKS
jgi:uncharacterized membrane protein YeaQ/YmgE (transglycosylase-associated protein family)